MTTYDPDLMQLYAVQPSGRLPIILGASRLGTSTETLRLVPTSSISLASGYSVGQLGELSIDPITATGSLAEVGEGLPDPNTPLLDEGDYVQVRYGEQVLFTGVVDTIDTTLEAIARRPGEWTKRFSYTLLSRDAILLGKTITWADLLPAEGALFRLRRWFTVDISGVDISRRAILYEPMGPEEAGGSMTLLDAARAFTARTLLPLISKAEGSTHLRVVDECQTWDGVPPARTSPLTANAADWTHSAGFAVKPRLSSLMLNGPDTPTYDDIEMARETRNEYGSERLFEYGAKITGAGAGLTRGLSLWTRFFQQGSGSPTVSENRQVVPGVVYPRLQLNARRFRVEALQPGDDQWTVYYSKWYMDHDAIAKRFPTLTHYKLKFSMRRHKYTTRMGKSIADYEENVWEAAKISIGGVEMPMLTEEYTTRLIALSDPDRDISTNLVGDPPLPRAGDVEDDTDRPPIRSFGVIFERVDFLPEPPVHPINHVLMPAGGVTLPSDAAQERTVKAPFGTQHLENFSKIFSLATSRYLATTAQVVTNDAVMLDAAHRPPDVMGTVDGGAFATARLQQSFTIKQLNSSVEFAPPIRLNSTPFDVTPYVVSNSGGHVNIGYSLTPAAWDYWSGDMLWLLSTGGYITSNADTVPWQGHQIPATAETLLWVPRPGSAGAAAVGFSSTLGAKSGDPQDLEPGKRYFLSIYLTSIGTQEIPTASGATRSRLSYPSPTLSWLQQ